MPQIGDSFFFRAIGAHLYVVITDPEGPDRKFVMVNIETNSGAGEGACILEPVDDNGSFIREPSEVRYKDALLWQETGPKGYNAQNAAGVIRPYNNLKPATLAKIQDGAFRSELFRYFETLRPHLVNPITGDDDTRVRARRMLGLPC